MPFAQSNGYTPRSIDSIMEDFRLGVNDEFSLDFTATTFKGANFYKYFYAAAQLVQKNEVKASEIFLYLQQYFALTNLRINRPKVTAEGIVDAFTEAGYVASVKPMIDADKGKINICVDVDDGADDYATTKIAICTLIKNIVTLGCPTYGSESETIALSNGQAFDWKYHLPNKIPVLLKLTVALSENNTFEISSDDDVKQKLFDQIAARYRVGLDFEPQKYFEQSDAPWSGSVLLEWSDDAGMNWFSDIYDADFDDKYTFELTDITIVNT